MFGSDVLLITESFEELKILRDCRILSVEELLTIRIIEQEIQQLIKKTAADCFDRLLFPFIVDFLKSKIFTLSSFMKPGTI
jgi:hypothetical protein